MLNYQSYCVNDHVTRLSISFIQYWDLKGKSIEFYNLNIFLVPQNLK